MGRVKPALFLWCEMRVKKERKRKEPTENIPSGESMVVAAEPVELEVADCDTWRYHETEQPRMFKSGQQIPAGWTRENRKFWQVNANGVMERVNG